MALNRISIVAMLYVFKATAAETDWETLLKQYKDFGLPLPPPEAELVYVDTGWSNGNTKLPLRVLGFQLQKENLATRGDVLVGTLNLQKVRTEAVPLANGAAPVPAALDSFSVEWRDHMLEGLNVAVPVAIQCRARGWNALADAMLKKGLSESSGHAHGVFVQPRNLHPSESLAHIAYTHYANLLFEQGSDWSALYPKLKSVIDASPCLQNKRKTWLTDALALSLKPSKAVPGTTEALIDSLVQENTNTGPFGQNYGGEYPPSYAKILALGFDAVPLLVEHLNDERLTRTIRVGFNNFPSWPVRVGDVVSDLLCDIAGGDLGRDWLRRQKGYRVEKDAVLNWYAGVRNNEESHLIAKALEVDDKKHTPNLGITEILAQKYPQGLVEVYLKLLKEHPRLQSHSVLDALAKTTLPEKEKLRLYLLGAKHDDLEQRRAAFWKLKDADHEQFVALLVETLNGLPETPSKPYWSCREASFCSLLMQTTDKRAWTALLAAARRADVGLRFEMIQLYKPEKLTPAIRRQTLLYLSHFLYDETLRDVKTSPALYEGPNAAMEFSVLSVQNHATNVLAAFLELPGAKEDFSAEDWSRLRKTVQEALEKEALPKEFE